MNYEQALKYIAQSNKFGIRLGLDNIGKLLELLGNPQDSLDIIHVAGTNGKGSTCSFISSILKEAGYKVGLYTSPYLETFTERIRVNGENIPEPEVGRIIELIKSKIEKMVKEGYSYPTEFEIVTAMAFYYYAEQKVDFLVLEVGLGGRYDGTNIIKKSLASVITSISLDHVNILGDTLEKIAYEKAGIIKENGTVVVYDQSEEVKGVIKGICSEKNAKYIEVKFSGIDIKKSDIYSQVFDCTILGKRYEDLEIKLIGEHQVNNSVLALSVLECLNLEVDEMSIRNGLLNTRWPGRIEKIKEEPIFIIDGAHNEEGARSLRKSLDHNFKGKKLTLLIGMLEDKDIDSVLDILMPIFSRVITTTPDNPRAISSETLAQKISMYVSDVTSKRNIDEAVRYILDTSNKDDIIISAGSLYMIGEVRKLINS